jgi:outer membrane phospholipase A
MSKFILGITTLMSLALPALPAIASEQWLIASQTEQMDFGQQIAFDLVKPADVRLWPETLTIRLSSQDSSEDIELIASPAPELATSHAYIGIARKPHNGLVRAELVTLSSNRLLMLATTATNAVVAVAAPADVKPVEPEPVAAEQKPNSGATVMIANPAVEPTLSTNEPIYFVLGHDRQTGTDARFQISFKYRPFDPESSVATFMPAFSKLYFAYTQTTLWDLGAESGPFRDTSYRPSLFYQWMGSGADYMPSQWRVGAEHESNGQSGLISRSLNTVFVQPSWNVDLDSGKRFTFFPRIYQYVDKGENPDIQRYRGYVDWRMRYGREDGLIFSALYRQGSGGYSAAQLDLSHVISDRIFGRTGSFVHLQLMSGYGETLLDFNKKNDTQLRIGLSIAR